MFTVSNAYLDNGLKIILRNIPNQRTVSCGVWINQGGKNETDDNNGISHLIEHLMFKINSKNFNESMPQLLENLDNIGARYNATTTKDYTCFYIDGLKSDIEIMLKTLSALVMNKENVKDSDLESEKEVVLRETERYLMSSTQIGERLGQALWGDYSIGQLVIGKPNVIKNINKNQIDGLIDKAYIPDNSILVIVGGFDEDKVFEIINKYFSNWTDKYKDDVKIITQPKPGIYVDDSFGGDRSTIGIGLRAYPSGDWRSRYVQLLVSLLVRPGSNLFKELREKRGLVYSISGISLALMSAGMMGVVFSGNNIDLLEIVRIIMDEFNRLKVEGVDECELENIKRIRNTEILYGIESTSNQLMTIGANSIRGQSFLLEDELREVNKVSLHKMNMIIQDLFISDVLCLAILGDTDIEKIVQLLELNGGKL